jgi:hypothetical protein
MVNKSSKIKDRVLEIAEFKGISKEKFFEKIGMTYGNFKGKSKETPLNSNAIADILTIYSDINPLWLLTGNGSMILTENQPVNKSCEEIIENYKGMLDSYKQMAEMQLKQIELLQTQLQESNQMVTFSKIESKRKASTKHI